MLGIEANISGAKIYIDNKYVGFTDIGGTLIVKNITAGKHTIKATKEGYNDATATITVPSQTTVTLKLTRKTYTVTINVVD